MRGAEMRPKKGGHDGPEKPEKPINVARSCGCVFLIGTALLTTAVVAVLSLLKPPKNEPTELPPVEHIRPHSISGDGESAAAIGWISTRHDKLGRSFGYETIRVWNQVTGSPNYAREFQLPQRGMSSPEPIAVSSDGRILALKCSASGRVDHVVFWDIASAQVIRDVELSLPASATRVRPAWMAFNPDGRSVSVISDGVFVTADSTADRADYKQLPPQFGRESAYAPKVGRLYWVDRPGDQDTNGRLLVWDARRGGEDAPVDLKGTGRGNFICLGVSSSGQSVATCWWKGHGDERKVSILVHSVATGELLARFMETEYKNLYKYEVLAVSPDGAYVAGIGEGNSVRMGFNSLDVFRVGDQSRVFRAAEEGPDVPHRASGALTFTDNGRYLIFNYRQQSLRRIDLTTFTELEK